jgi:hypothetical protein
MIRIFLALSLLASTLIFAQSIVVPQGAQNFTLQDRYTLMKSKAETYQDYKVIKESLLDEVWKVTLDSLRSQKLLVVEGRQTLSKYEADLKTTQLTLANERETASGIVYASTHISILGIDIVKGVFVTIIAIIFSSFILLVSSLVLKMKLLRATANEKIVIADLITKEFEEFKHKAHDKQIKLSRELQTERNKLIELKSR